MALARKKYITKGHDLFVKTVLSNQHLAKEFFTIHLPNDIRERIDLNHLKLQPNSYINDVRKETVADILYETKIADKNAYLYLLVEHQSSPDHMMAFRLLKYTCNVMDACLKKNQCIPLVYPLVIYHAPKKWSFSTDIKDLIEAPKELIEKYFLKPFQLIDLGAISDEELKQHQWIGIMEFALKHIFARDVLEHLQCISELMHDVALKGGSDYVEIVLQYALIKGDVKNVESFINFINNNISSEVGKKIMTGAEQLRQEGIIKGKAEGKAEERLAVAKRMNHEGLAHSLISKLTGLSLEQIEMLNWEKV